MKNCSKNQVKILKYTPEASLKWENALQNIL